MPTKTLIAGCSRGRQPLPGLWRIARVVTVLVISLSVLSACSGVVAAPPPDDSLSDLSGRIIIDGSSTVYPVSQAIAEEFGYLASNVQIPIGVSGTGGGFTKFCTGETTLNNASRPIRDIEAAECAANGIEFIELPIAFDGLSVLINPANDWVACLTVDQLQRIWEPEAEGVITSWAQVDPSFPDEPLLLYGPGTDSGTYEYFTEVITGETGGSRGDFTSSEDDNILIQGVAGNESALGFFGFAYYVENQDKLKLVAVDNGDGCIEPSGETIANGTYQPLSRPIYIYVNADHAMRDETAALVDFYLNHGTSIIQEVGYIPFPEEMYATLVDRFQAGRTGSVFLESGITGGVRLEDLLFEEER